jgi:hypothetical protein
MKRFVIKDTHTGKFLRKKRSGGYNYSDWVDNVWEATLSGGEVTQASLQPIPMVIIGSSEITEKLLKLKSG